MKKVLFVANTIMHTDADKVLVTLLQAINQKEYEIDLLVIFPYADALSELPNNINVLNKTNLSKCVSKQKKRLWFFQNAMRYGSIFITFPYTFTNYWRMLERNNVLKDCLWWKTMARGTKRFSKKYDIAIAFGEGAATYYVADYVNASKKTAWVHKTLNPEGFNEYLDGDSYDKIHHIFAVSEEVKESFLEIHPECASKIDIFYNLIDQENIRRLAKEGNADGYKDKGLRLLTVGKLNSQKAYDVAIQAMVYLRKWHYPIKWYVIGDGPLQKTLQGLIDQKKLTDDFILLGKKENPYPYFANCDIYVHATRFEGKSIAIQEAQTLGCAVIVSDVSGNREQVVNGYDGFVCDLNGRKLAEAIADMAEDPYIRKRMGNRNMAKDLGYSKKSIDQLFRMIEQ